MIDYKLESVIKECQLFEEALNQITLNPFVDEFITKFMLSNLK